MYGFGRLRLGIFLLVRTGQVNVKVVHDATNDIERFRGAKVIAKSVLANVPSVVIRTNTVLEIDRVELSGNNVFGVDDLVGTLDGEH